MRAVTTKKCVELACKYPAVRKAGVCVARVRLRAGRIVSGNKNGAMVFRLDFGLPLGIPCHYVEPWVDFMS